MIGEGEANAVCRVRAKGDFKLSEHTGEPVAVFWKFPLPAVVFLIPRSQALSKQIQPYCSSIKISFHVREKMAGVKNGHHK